MIQTIGVTLNYLSLTDFSNNEYIYGDLVLVLPLAFFMNYSKPSKILSKEIPNPSLTSFSCLLSIIGMILIQILFQV